jgi:photosystem II stability/assembly factor-like uncharacterized protein
MSKYSYCSTLAIGCPVYNDVKRTSLYTNAFLSDGSTYYRTNSSGIIFETGTCPTEAFIQYATIDGNYLKKSRDGGTSWYTAFANSGTSNWTKVDASQNGQYVVVIDSHYVLISTSYGSEFSFSSVKYSSSTTFKDIAISNNGQFLVLVEATGYIWTSFDYGVNWTARSSAGNRAWQTCSISGNGQYMLASAGNYHDRLYRSGDYGVSWQPVSSTYYYHNSAISDTGQYQIVLRQDGYIPPYSTYMCVSSDYGLNWSDSSPQIGGYHRNVAVSSTGQYMVVGGSSVYYNTNYGTTGWWAGGSLSTGDSYFTSAGMSMSSNGKVVLVADVSYSGNNYLYKSTNYGVNYTKLDSDLSAGSQNWSSVVIAPETPGGGGNCPSSGVQIGDAYCSGYNYVALYTDGSCGTYEGVIYYDYSGCGYYGGGYSCDCGSGCALYVDPCYYIGCYDCDPV